MRVTSLYKKDETEIKDEERKFQEGNIDWVLSSLGSLTCWDEVRCLQYISPNKLGSKTWVPKDRRETN